MRTSRQLIGALVAALLGVLAAVALATTVRGATDPASASAQAARTGEPWDLVYISDSSGWGVARFYAGRIKQHLGVSVRVHDEWVGDLSARTILERLRTPGDPWIRLVRNADVIVVYGNFSGLGIKQVENCIFAKTPVARGPRYWRPYVVALKAIYKRIFELRNGRPVILRTANWYVPIVSRMKQAGILDACTRWAESWSAAIVRAAATYRIPVADVYTAFNGTDHREDPSAKGYLQPDGIHPSGKGRAVIAKKLAALGYKRVTPPR